MPFSTFFSLVTQICITGFKNYVSNTFDFSKRIVAICGMNGKGKTNLLDALHYLCFTKSYFSKSDPLNVRFGGEGFRIEGHIGNDDEQKKLVCIYRSGARKEFSLNDIAYDKFSQHIGLYPAVMIAPDDVEMITGGSEGRRNFLDTLISQLDATYLQQLIVYNRVLAQRNSFLKDASEKGFLDHELLAVFNSQLESPAAYIHATRTQFCTELIPMIHQFYEIISGSAEKISVTYQSQLHQEHISALLNQSLSKDRATQRTNVGTHKDDLNFLLGDSPFKLTASQGQRKSLLFACKLAEFEIIRIHKGTPPYLFLDDVFEKLDETRMENLLNYVCKENTGQVFITDTHADRLQAAVAAFKNEVQMILLN